MQDQAFRCSFGQVSFNPHILNSNEDAEEEVRWEGNGPHDNEQPEKKRRQVEPVRVGIVATWRHCRSANHRHKVREKGNHKRRPQISCQRATDLEKLVKCYNSVLKHRMVQHAYARKEYSTARATLKWFVYPTLWIDPFPKNSFNDVQTVRFTQISLRHRWGPGDAWHWSTGAQDTPQRRAVQQSWREVRKSSWKAAQIQTM